MPGGLRAFVKTRPDLAVPDVEFMFRGAPPDVRLWFPLVKPAYADGFAIRPTLLHPDSRGDVRLRSADPRDPPQIIGNFLSAPGDLPRLREGFRRARDVARQKPLDPFRGIETGPGPEARSDADVDAWIRSTAITAHHPAGTCQMGIGPDSVLDPELRVRGIERLRVVDASAMPDLVIDETAGVHLARWWCGAGVAVHSACPAAEKDCRSAPGSRADQPSYPVHPGFPNAIGRTRLGRRSNRSCRVPRGSHD